MRVSWSVAWQLAVGVSSDETKSNHQDSTKITKADHGRAGLIGSIANLVGDEVGDPLPEVSDFKAFLVFLVPWFAAHGAACLAGVSPAMGVGCVPM